MATPPDLTIAVVLYDEMTTLDVVGPMEMLRFLPGSRLSFVAERVGPIETDTGVLTLGATVTFDDDLAPDVVVVPGGPGTKAAMASPLIGWLRRVHPTTRWTTSVCSGSLLLGAAGLLEGARATSHFAVAEHLDRFGAAASGGQRQRGHRRPRDRDWYPTRCHPIRVDTEASLIASPRARDDANRLPRRQPDLSVQAV